MTKNYIRHLLLLCFLIISSSSKGGHLYQTVQAYKQNGLIPQQSTSLFAKANVQSAEVSQSLSQYVLLNADVNALKKVLQNKPKYLRLALPDPSGSGTMTLELFAKEIYKKGFQPRTTNHSVVSPLNAMNYHGVVAGNSNSFAAISIYENEVMGLISNEKGNFNLGKMSGSQSMHHIFYNDAYLNTTIPFVCGTTKDRSKGNTQLRTSNNPNSINSTNCVNFYWETDQDIYTDKGSVGAVSTYINGLFTQVSAEYANDGITANLSDLLIWDTADPYVGPSTGDYLDQFGVERTSFNGDLGTLLGYDGGGGIAWIDVICEATTSYRMAYAGIDASYNNIPTYSWTVEVVSHEQGHNMASPHTHDCVWNGNSTAIDGCGPNAGYASDPSGCAQGPIPAKGTIMSYCHLSPNTGINLALGFGPLPLALILSRIDNASCLTVCSITNDDICDATSLTVTAGGVCTPESGDNTGATNSGIANVNCDGASDGDVWFTATVPASGSIEINTLAGDLTDMGMAIYTGACASPTLINCYSGGNQVTSTMPRTVLTGRTPGETLWIRLWDVDNDQSGSFQICASEPCNSSVTISGSTTACSAAVPQLCATAGFSSYSWSTGATTQCITPASSGTYTVTATAANGCTATDTHTITINASPTVSLTGVTAACLNTNPQLCTNTTFTSYLWSNAATTQCINPPSSGTYIVTVTNAAGCTATASRAVTIYPNFTATVTGADSSCTSSLGQLCSSAGSSYLWSNGATTQCISPSTSGTYAVTVTNANGCTSSASKATAVYTNPTASITGPTSGCTGSTVQLCANAGSYSYNWSNTSTTQCVNLTTSGNYSVTITDTHGCTASTSHSLTFGSSLSVNITGPANACPSTGAQLCADAGFASYSWSNGQTTQCITPSTTGLYSVTVTDNGGCTATNSKSITFYTAPTVTVSGPSSACANTFPQLCASGGMASYSWSSTETTQCIAPSTSGSYQVTATDANGCTASAAQSITILANPTISIAGPGTICPGSSTSLCASTNGSSLLWSTNETTSCIAPPDSGSYSVVSTSNNGCTSSAFYQLNYYPEVAATITGPNAACFGSTAQICAPAGFTSYLWSGGQTTQCIDVTSTGTYSVTATDANGCTSTASHTINFGASLNLTITGPAGVCPGQTTQLCASVVGTTLWSTGATSQCITPTASGNYTVTVTDVNGCTGSATKAFTAYPTFSANISGPSSVCYGVGASLCAPTGAGYHYVWNTGDTTRCISGTTSGIYTVTITNQNGCTASNSKGLTVYSQLNATISGPNSLCTGSVAQLCAPTGSSLYQWSTGSTSRCINVNNTGTYTVTVTDANGCTASNSLLVTFSSSITTVITGSHNPCAGEPLELCVPTGYADYAWNTGATTECITVSSSGTYSVTIHDATGCVGNDTQLVAYQNRPPVLIAGQSDICQGQVGILCATSGYPNYQWNNGDTQSCITVDSTGSYVVTITDAAGCTNSTSINVNVTDLNPTISITPNGLVALPYGLQYTYSWSSTSTPFGGCTGDTCTAAHTGDYTVVVSDLITGCTDSTTIYYVSLGTDNLPEAQTISIYPNPLSSAELNVNFDFNSNEKINLRVTDALGQILVSEIFVKAGAVVKQLNFADYAAGMYLINVHGENWNRTLRVIKQ